MGLPPNPVPSCLMDPRCIGSSITGLKVCDTQCCMKEEDVRPMCGGWDEGITGVPQCLGVVCGNYHGRSLQGDAVGTYGKYKTSYCLARGAMDGPSSTTGAYGWKLAGAHGCSSDAKNIVELAAGIADLSTLVTALKAGKLVTALSGTGPFTVFAPTNEAFAALPAATLASLLKPANIKQLDAILEYRVIAGAAVRAENLKASQDVKTLEGQKLHITKAAGSVTVQKAKVIMADVAATNGVVHVINGVLIPPAPLFCMHQEDTVDHKCFEACAPTEFAMKGIHAASLCPSKYNTADKTQVILQCPDGLTSLRYCPDTALNVTVKTKGEELTVTLLKEVEPLAPTEKCCTDCEAPQVKYFSVDVPHGFCGETCIRPRSYELFHLFEKNLTRATDNNPCREQFTPNGGHYTNYTSTVSHGGFGLKVTLDLYGPVPAK